MASTIPISLSRGFGPKSLTTRRPRPRRSSRSRPRTKLDKSGLYSCQEFRVVYRGRLGEFQSLLCHGIEYLVFTVRCARSESAAGSVVFGAAKTTLTSRSTDVTSALNVTFFFNTLETLASSALTSKLTPRYRDIPKSSLATTTSYNPSGRSQVYSSYSEMWESVGNIDRPLWC